MRLAIVFALVLTLSQASVAAIPSRGEEMKFTGTGAGCTPNVGPSGMTAHTAQVDGKLATYIDLNRSYLVGGRIMVLGPGISAVGTVSVLQITQRPSIPGFAPTTITKVLFQEQMKCSNFKWYVLVLSGERVLAMVLPWTISCGIVIEFKGERTLRAKTCEGPGWEVR